jgi:putative heme iron utilization protein
MSDAVDFPPEAVAGVMRHMNGDHAEDCLIICRGLGAVPAATAARMTGFDADAISFVATVEGVEAPVRVPWAQRVASRPEVRTAVVQLYRDACAALGIEPRSEEER